MFKIYLRCNLCGKHIGYLKTGRQYLFDDGQPIELITDLIMDDENHIMVMCEDCMKLIEEGDQDDV